MRPGLLALLSESAAGAFKSLWKFVLLAGGGFLLFYGAFLAAGYFQTDFLVSGNPLSLLLFYIFSIIFSLIFTAALYFLRRQIVKDGGIGFWKGFFNFFKIINIFLLPVLCYMLLSGAETEFAAAGFIPALITFAALYFFIAAAMAIFEKNGFLPVLKETFNFLRNDFLYKTVIFLIVLTVNMTVALAVSMLMSFVPAMIIIYCLYYYVFALMTVFYKYYIKPPQPQEQEKITTLMSAAIEGDAEKVKEIISKNPSQINKKFEDTGATALWLACWNGKAETAAALISAGADKTIAAKNGLTPLEAARQKNFEEIIKLLEA